MGYSIVDLGEEHSEINVILSEIEEIIDSEEINFSNLVHTFNKFFHLWDEHEKNEEELFSFLEKNKINFPIFKFIFEHRELRGHKKVLEDAIKSGSDFKIKVALDTDGRILINKIKRHMAYEDDILYSLPKEELIFDSSNL